MPWAVKRDSRCPVGRPFGVVKETDGGLVGCHVSRGEARAQQAALYAGEATKRIGFVPAELKAFDPHEARDPAGRWTDTPGVAMDLIGDLSHLKPDYAASVRADVAKIPADAQKVLAAHNVRVVSTERLSGVAGTHYDPTTHEAVISNMAAVTNPGQAPVVLHELAHAFDQATGDKSKDPAFRVLWKDAKPVNPYFRRKFMGGDPRQEMFAEAAAHIWNGTSPPASDFVLTEHLRELITGLASLYASEAVTA